MTNVTWNTDELNIKTMAEKMVSYKAGRNRTYNFKDLTNIRYGRLVTLEAVGKDKNRHIMWECICDCGNKKVVAGTSLISGYTTSCGCYYKEVVGTHGIKHGKCKTKLYYVYRGMIARCYGKERKYHKRYKDKIFVCDRWLEGFQNFYDDMAHSYIEGLSLDRIDNNGNYEPSNCRWATAEVQSNNKSNNKLYEVGGKLYSISQLERMSGTYRSTIQSRLKRGWDINSAVYGEPVYDIKQISEYLVF